MIEITPRQRELARHALGFDGRQKFSTRNYFVAGVVDLPDWEELVRKGLADTGAPTELTGGDPVYWCRRELALFVRERDEHLDREFRDGSEIKRAYDGRRAAV